MRTAPVLAVRDAYGNVVDGQIELHFDVSVLSEQSGQVARPFFFFPARRQFSPDFGPGGVQSSRCLTTALFLLRGYCRDV